MGRFTEISLADVVKVIRHLDPDTEYAALTEAFVGLLGSSCYWKNGDQRTNFSSGF